MSEKVSTFVNVSAGKVRYLFFLVTWNDFASPIREQLEKQLDPFGEALGELGKVVQGYSNSTFNEVVAKDWDLEQRAQLENDPDPFLLVIDQDFATFSPSENRWGLIRLSSFHDKPDAIYRLLAALVRKVRQNEDLFLYLRTVALKKKASRFTKYLEIKPNIFGVTLDISSILDDLLA